MRLSLNDVIITLWRSAKFLDRCIIYERCDGDSQCGLVDLFALLFVSLQGVVYQLDVALESVDTQRSGLIFIYDMSDSKYANFDYDLSQKILTLLKVIHLFHTHCATFFFYFPLTCVTHLHRPLIYFVNRLIVHCCRAKCDDLSIDRKPPYVAEIRLRIPNAHEKISMYDIQSFLNIYSSALRYTKIDYWLRLSVIISVFQKDQNEICHILSDYETTWRNFVVFRLQDKGCSITHTHTHIFLCNMISNNFRSDPMKMPPSDFNFSLFDWWDQSRKEHWQRQRKGLEWILNRILIWKFRVAPIPHFFKIATSAPSDRRWLLASGVPIAPCAINTSSCYLAILAPSTSYSINTRRQNNVVENLLRQLTGSNEPKAAESAKLGRNSSWAIAYSSLNWTRQTLPYSGNIENDEPSFFFF